MTTARRCYCWCCCCCYQQQCVALRCRLERAQSAHRQPHSWTASTHRSSTCSDSCELAQLRAHNTHTHTHTHTHTQAHARARRDFTVEASCCRLFAICCATRLANNALSTADVVATLLLEAFAVAVVAVVAVFGVVVDSSTLPKKRWGSNRHTHNNERNEEKNKTFCSKRFFAELTKTLMTLLYF